MDHRDRNDVTVHSGAKNMYTLKILVKQAGTRLSTKKKMASSVEQRSVTAPITVAESPSSDTNRAMN